MHPFPSSAPILLSTLHAWLTDLGWSDLTQVPLEGTGAVVLSAYSPFPLVAETAPSACTEQEAKRRMRALRVLLPTRSLIWLQLGEDRSYLLGSMIGSRQEAEAHRGELDRLQGWEYDLWRSFQETKDPTLAMLRVHNHLERRELHRSFFRNASRALAQLARSFSSPQALNASERHRLALQLLARLVFLQLLQQRGWLRNHPRFLAEELLRPGRRDLFRRCLLPIFRTLATPTSHRAPDDSYRDLPELTGGLFEADELEERHPELSLPDEVITSLLRDVFERHRFVQSESSEELAAIEPTLLGTLFERMMSSGERSRSGSFYTPAGLVDQLVQQALDPLLQERLGEELAHRLSVGGLLDEEEAQRVIGCLTELRILDPAVGSGAFLLGVLRHLTPRLCLARRRLDPAVTRAEVMHELIRRCLHGIDQQPMALTIASLRLWLAVISAATSAQDLRALRLPELGHQLRTGDALVSPTRRAAIERIVLPEPLRRELAEAAEGLTTAQDRATARRRMEVAEDACSRFVIEQARARHAELAEALERPAQRDLPLPDVEDRAARSPVPALEALRREQEALGHLLEQADRHGWKLGFDARLHWPWLQERGGFDVVIGNPPWVRGAQLDAGTRATLARLWPEMRPQGRAFGVQPDLSVAFVAASLDWLRPGGLLGFVLPSRLLRADYARRLRARLVTESTLLRIDDLSARGENPFQAATSVALLVAQRTRPAPEHRVWVRGDGAPEFTFQRALSTEGPGSPLILCVSEHRELAQRLAELHPPLSAQLTVRYGVKTGCNEAFLDPPPLPLCVPALRGADLRAWQPRGDTRLLLAHDLQTLAPLAQVPEEVRLWLDPFRERLEARADAGPETPLWSVFRLHHDSLGHRVLVRDVATELEAAPVLPVAEGGPIALNTTWSIGVPDRLTALRLSAWLNGRWVRCCARIRAEPLMNGYRRFRAATLSQLPCPEDLSAPGASRWAEVDRLVLSLPLDELARRSEALEEALLPLRPHSEEDRRAATLR